MIDIIQNFISGTQRIYWREAGHDMFRVVTRGTNITQVNNNDADFVRY